jgi:predicted ArsR family transcriptional regulator
MEKVSIPQEAVDLNLNWIDSLETCLAECGNQALTKVVMRAAGKKCSVQIYDDCRQILGKNPESVDELLDAMNQRRSQNHNLTSLWEKQGNTAHLILEECNCTLVKAGLAKPNPVHCLCSQGMMESLFYNVYRGQVSVELVKSIGNGHDVCEFNVTFEE